MIGVCDCALVFLCGVVCMFLRGVVVAAVVGNLFLVFLVVACAFGLLSCCDIAALVLFCMSFPVLSAAVSCPLCSVFAVCRTVPSCGSAPHLDTGLLRLH